MNFIANVVSFLSFQLQRMNFTLWSQLILWPNRQLPVSVGSLGPPTQSTYCLLYNPSYCLSLLWRTTKGREVDIARCDGSSVYSSLAGRSHWEREQEAKGFLWLPGHFLAPDGMTPILLFQTSSHCNCLLTSVGWHSLPCRLIAVWTEGIDHPAAENCSTFVTIVDIWKQPSKCHFECVCLVLGWLECSFASPLWTEEDVCTWETLNRFHRSLSSV